MIRRGLGLALLLLAACGDDARVGPRGAPAGASPEPPAGTPASTAPPARPAPGPEAAEADPWASTRVGDWATWEVRVEGSDAVTRLTWRATKAAGGRGTVEYTVSSKTTTPDGKVLATQETTGAHEAGGGLAGDVVPGTKSFDVGGKSIGARGRRAGAVEWWWSTEVPFHGLVHSKGGGVEQTLVAFGRGP